MKTASNARPVILRLLRLFVPLWWTLNCAGAAQPNIDKPDVIDSQLHPAVQEALELLKDAPDCYQSEEGPCKPVEVFFQPKSGHESSLGQRVLILDSNLEFLGFTRFHQRVLDFLDVGVDGKVATTTRSIKIAALAKQIAYDLLGEKYANVHARYLEAVS